MIGSKDKGIMRILYKAWAATLLMMTGVFVVALHANAACNLADGTTITVVFDKAADGVSGNAYGFDNMNTPNVGSDDHVSVDEGESTYVTVKIDMNNDGVWDPVSDLSNFTFTSDKALIADVGNIPSSTTAAGFPLEIQAQSLGSGTSSGTATIKASYAGANGVCGSIMAHVYEEKTIAQWDIYYLPSSTPSFSDTDVEGYANSVAKKGVLKFSQVILHTSVPNCNYDINGNGDLDYYLDTDDYSYQPEFSVIQNAGLAGSPKSIIVSELSGAWRLSADATDGTKTLELVGGASWIENKGFVGHNFMLGDDGVAEVVRVVSIDGNQLTLESGVKTNHSAGEVLYQRSVGGLSTDPQVVEDSPTEPARTMVKLLHEVLHTDVGNLGDISDSSAGNNVMFHRISGDGSELRYKKLVKLKGGMESQWDKIHAD